MSNYWFNHEGTAPTKIVGQFNLVSNVDPTDVVYKFTGECGKGTSSLLLFWCRLSSVIVDLMWLLLTCRLLPRYLAVNALYYVKRPPFFDHVGGAAVAVSKFGNGAVAYFGDVRGDDDSLCAIMMFMVAARLRARIHSSIPKAIAEKPTQIWVGAHASAYVSCAEKWELLRMLRIICSFDTSKM